MGTRRRIAAAILAVTAVLATGCQHGGSSTATAPQTSPTTTGFEMPDPTAPANAAGQSVDPRPAPPKSTSGDTEPVPAVLRARATSSSVAPGPAPHDPGVFTIVLTTRQVGTLTAVVSPMTVPADTTIVSPPEPAGCPWTGPSQVQNHGNDVPPGCDWSQTSIWVRNAAYPTAPAGGITYIYGHACRSHICPFSPVQETSGGGYTVQPGDTAVITTPTETLTYRVCAVASSPKHGGPAIQPTCPSTVDLDIITCGYGPNDTSDKNIIISATLTSPTPRST